MQEWINTKNRIMILLIKIFLIDTLSENVSTSLFVTCKNICTKENILKEIKDHYLHS